MAVAQVTYFTREHIEAQRFEAPPFLAEEAIHCLELVSELVASGLSFQFKGGNSLLILLPRPRRFSIDVDIATDASVESIERSLDAIVTRYGVFTRWEKRQHKTKPWIPLNSYYLFFDSCFDRDEPPSVMLDVQMGRSPYRTEFKPIRCGDLYTCHQQVEIPLVSSMVGDKLLTLGPYTLGIPVGKGKDAQRIKHVFDLSTLLALSPPLDEIRVSFTACTGHENRLQKKNIRAEQLLSDTLALCASVVKHPYTPDPAKGDLPDVFVENARGLEPFRNHLFSKQYSWHSLQCDMARVALCITAVCVQDVGSDEFRAALSNARPCSPSAAHRGRTVEIQDEEVQYYWDHVCEWLGKRGPEVP